MKINMLNISRSFLALAATLAVSAGSSHATTLVYTDFSTATPAAGSGLNAWDTSTAYGHLNFGAGGAVSNGGYYSTTATLTSAAALSASPTWVDAQLTINSINLAASDKANSSESLSLNLSDGSNITLGGQSSPTGYGGTLTGTTAWNSVYTAPSYAGDFRGTVTPPTDTEDYLLKITSTGTTDTVQYWIYDDTLGGLPSTDPTGSSDGLGAAYSGSFTFDSTATSLSSINLGGQNLVGTYSSLVVANSYANILNPEAPAVPEPSTFSFMAFGSLALAGLAARRKFCV